MNKIITHFLYSKTPKANNTIEQHFRNSLSKSMKNKKRTTDELSTTLTTEKWWKNLKNTPKKLYSNN